MNLCCLLFWLWWCDCCFFPLHCLRLWICLELFSDSANHSQNPTSINVNSNGSTKSRFSNKLHACIISNGHGATNQTKMKFAIKIELIYRELRPKSMLQWINCVVLNLLSQSLNQRAFIEWHKTTEPFYNWCFYIVFLHSFCVLFSEQQSQSIGFRDILKCFIMWYLDSCQNIFNQFS